MSSKARLCLLALTWLGVTSAATAPMTAPRAYAMEPVEPRGASSAPAVRYASLGQVACEAELKKRGVAFTRVDSARGVLAPVRLTSGIRGITYRTELPAKQRATSPYEILDCRLVLALDDFSSILAKHDVVEVLHYSVYRPPPTPSASHPWPSGKVGARHDGGLAIDAGKFVTRDGSVLDVEKDFHGRIGSATCGPSTGPVPATKEALALREIVCDAAEQRLFNVELTPDYNWEHRNHFHLEVTANAKWFLVH
jgi:hypothetical protein